MEQRLGAAIAQDWLAAEAGSERVTLELSRLLPAAPIYTSFFDPRIFDRQIDSARVRTWSLQRLLGPTRHFRSLLPLYPWYFGRLDLRRYGLVVSSSVAFTHAVRTAPGATHVSYVYTPLRYAWDLDTYLAGSSWSLGARLGARTLRPWLRRWDRSTAGRPDVVIGISEAVRKRIRRHWGREAEVIYPPVDVEQIPVSNRNDGFLLVAARMLAYRRLDLAVYAATALGRELVVVGDGPERARLESRAGPTVRFLGRIDRPSLLDLFARCHAYLVPGVEDFGIAPVEAMAAGKPVVGFRGGGVAETVVDGATGVLFDRQDGQAMAEAIERLEGLAFDPSVIRANAERFSTQAFRRKFVELFQRLDVDPSLYVPG
jgi:glycosyltransferase involved in cell wall biosynthesis